MEIPVTHPLAGRKVKTGNFDDVEANHLIGRHWQEPLPQVQARSVIRAKFF